MLDVNLPAEVEKRLDDLAEKIGVSKQEVAREAILAHIDDLEDLYLARRALEEGGQPIPLEALMKEFGLRGEA